MRMSRATLGLMLAALLASLLGYGAGMVYFGVAAPTPDGPVADFSLPDLDGETRRLSEWRGKLVLVNFWATWCPPCRDEIPLFIDLQREAGARGLQIVGVAIDQPDAVAAYSREMGINYPILLAGDDLELLNRYGNRTASLPYSVLIGPDGQPLARKLGAYHASELRRLLDAHLPPIDAQKR